MPDEPDSPFREQCFLYPWIKQRQDLFGSTVAVSGDFVAVGAPNRDTIHGYVPGFAPQPSNPPTPRPAAPPLP